MFSYAINTMRALTTDKKGAAMVEYGILVALIAVVVLVAVGPLGTAISGVFNGVTGSITGAA